MRVLLTRPREDSEALARLLAERGVETLIDPLLEIKPLAEAKIELEGVQAILATSANGVRVLASMTGERSIPVFAVGDASAREAQSHGFASVESASGDVFALAALVKAKLDPAKGVLFHAAGTKLAGDLAGMLKENGFEVRRVAIYEANPAPALSPEAVAAIKEKRIGGVLFYSPRTAATFSSLAVAADIVPLCAGIEAFCLSQAVAGKIAELPWKAVHVAEKPDQASLLALFEQHVPSAAKNRGAGRAMLLILLLAAAAAGGWFFYERQMGRPIIADGEPSKPVSAPVAPVTAQPAVPPPARTAPPPPQAKPLPAVAAASSPDERVARLEKRLDELTITLRRDVSLLEERLEKLEGGSAALPGETSALKGDLAGIAQRLEAAEAALRKSASREEAARGPLLIAIGQLREAVRNGAPFIAELQAVTQLSGAQGRFGPLIDSLGPLAASGVPRLSGLKKSFAALIPEINRASALPAGNDLWAETLKRLSAVVSVRRIDGDAASGDSGISVTSRAAARLEAEDLAGALAELAALDGAAAAKAAPWVEEAGRRLKAERTAAELMTMALANRTGG